MSNGCPNPPTLLVVEWTRLGGLFFQGRVWNTDCAPNLCQTIYTHSGRWENTESPVQGLFTLRFLSWTKCFSAGRSTDQTALKHTFKPMGASAWILEGLFTLLLTLPQASAWKLCGTKLFITFAIHGLRMCKTILRYKAVRQIFYCIRTPYSTEKVCPHASLPTKCRLRTRGGSNWCVYPLMKTLPRTPTVLALSMLRFLNISAKMNVEHWHSDA